MRRTPAWAKALETFEADARRAGGDEDGFAGAGEGGAGWVDVGVDFGVVGFGWGSAACEVEFAVVVHCGGFD